MPEPSSTSVPGSGTKCSVRMPKVGTTAEGPMFVLTSTGVTRRTTPDGAAVELVPEAGPCAKPDTEFGPIAATPVVHGLPVTVTFTKNDTVLLPPTPTTDRGTDTFAGGGCVHGAKRQTFAVPVRPIVPVNVPPPPPEKLPALLAIVAC